MSYSLVLGNEETLLATTSGWREFKEWIDSFESVGEELLQLTVHGVSQNLDRLESDLRLAIQTSPPETESLQETAVGLLETLMFRDQEVTTAHVSNGLGTADDDEDGPCEDINY